VNTPEGRRFAGEMTWAPGKAELRVAARTACACGCNKPDRVEFSLGGRTVAIYDALAVDALIEILRDGRRKLWGEP
jgi:hypothetical protein